MPSASAARKIDVRSKSEERSEFGSAYESEQSAYEPRFRAVSRRPLVRATRRTTTRGAHWPLVIAVIAGFCLLSYVLSWTLAMRGGYYRGQLQAQVKQLRIEQAELEAEKRRLQSPGMILSRAARELGMKPADQREFARIPAPQQVARNVMQP